MTDIQLTAEQAAAVPGLAEALKQGPVTVTVKQERWEPPEGEWYFKDDGTVRMGDFSILGARLCGLERDRRDHAEELAHMIRWTAITHAFRCDKAPDYVVPTSQDIINGLRDPAYFVATFERKGKPHASAFREGEARDPGVTYMPRDVAEEFCRLYNLGLIGGLGDE